MRLLVSLDIWIKRFGIYMLRYQIMICNRFCWSLSFLQAVPAYPDILCIICCLQSETAWKCNNVRDPYGVSIFLATGQPWPQYISPQNLGMIAYTMKKRRMWMIWGSMRLMCELEWNTALLTIPLTSDSDFYVPALEPQDDIMNIRCDVNWPKHY